MASSPITKDAKFARVDQGVDYDQKSPYMAIGDGTVIGVSKGWVGGTGDGLYIRLDHPITVNGTTYRDVYYAERTPLVKVGDKVKAGQPVMQGGSAELGFANGTSPYATLEGGLGKGTHPSSAGFDFLTMVHNLGYSQGQAVPVQATADPGAQPDASQTDVTPPVPDEAVQGVNQAIQNVGHTGAPVADMGTVADVGVAGSVLDTTYQPVQANPQGTWQLIAGVGPTSQDTQRLAGLASYGVNAPPSGP